MKLAYHPLLPLVESYVAIYKIYVLKNPLSNYDIFYVGQTIKDVSERLNQHINQTDSNFAKINYISSILKAGSRPVIDAIEVIQGTCYIDKQIVNERELYWIRYYKSLGCRLLNSAGTSPNARCNEYHGYLSSIKRGQSDWKYYYCGKTAGGIEVYDEKKVKADGFPFPKEDDYPYLNDNIRKKVGLPLNEPDESSKIKTVITEIFPEPLAWTHEFAKDIPYYSIMDDIEIDDCDLEDDELEDDRSDYEPCVDEEDDDSDIIEPSYRRTLFLDSLFIIEPICAYSLSPIIGLVNMNHTKT